MAEHPLQLQHRTLRMTGRDPDETHRAATPLELLFDLTFVIAFGTASNELAHSLTEDHVAAGIVGFTFVTFGIAWAWINFTWFASAYDTDDWLFRLLTMVQMMGVLVFALGLPAVFASIHDGETLDNDVLVWGYVVMRVAMVAQWWRASRHDPARRAAHRTYITTILAAQVIWCWLAIVDLSVGATFLAMCVPLAIEVTGPIIAERRFGGTPWHAGHIAERYGLMAIIVLGEGLIGTMASLTAIGDLNAEVVLLAAAGTAMTFGMWWTYFVVPHGEILELRRERSFGWGYGHIPLFGSIAAVGAGLHVAAYYIEHHSELGRVGTVLSVAVPLATYLLVFYILYAVFSRSLDPFHLLLGAISVALLAAPVAMAAADVDLVACLLVLALVPWVTVVGYETRGHRHNAEVLAALRG
ncbi:low temperature requirement protein A [Nocardioides sp. YIM 152588]|uniref:low temperature requirement protein A n=1 Tax=Nocardioides sp. YIM 152588 TaxID=3158259 RepID=UPI0032E3A741